jgi:hypothetical protein
MNSSFLVAGGGVTHSWINTTAAEETLKAGGGDAARSEPPTADIAHAYERTLSHISNQGTLRHIRVLVRV